MHGNKAMLHYDYPQKTHVEITQLFGKSFADTIFKMVPSGWQGPVVSGYGLHLVRITAREQGRVPDFREVRAKTYDDFVDQRRRQSYEAYYQSLRGKYKIEITASVLSEQELDL